MGKAGGCTIAWEIFAPLRAAEEGDFPNKPVRRSLQAYVRRDKLIWNSGGERKEVACLARLGIGGEGDRVCVSD